MVDEVDRPILERADDDAVPPEGESPPLDAVKRRRRPTGEPPPLPPEERWRGYRWGIVAAGAIGASLLLLAYNESAGIVATDEALARIAEAARAEPSVAAARALSWIGDEWPVRTLRWTTIAVLVGVRRFRHLFVFVGVVLAVEWAAAAMNFVITRPRPMVEIIGPWEGFSHPSRPVAGLAATLVGMIRVLLPRGVWRDRAFWAAVSLSLLVGLGRVHLGVDHVSDVLIALAMGVGAPMLAFRLLAPSALFPVVYRRGETAHLDLDARRQEAIRRAVADQLGYTVHRIEPFGTEGSAGSTPLRLRVSGSTHPVVFAKLYTRQHLRADRSYKLFRTLVYGQLEDEAPFTSVRRLVQYEDHMSRLLRDADVPTPEPLGVVEISPEREYLIAFSFVEGVELRDADIDDAVIDDALTVVQRLWAGGMAHRDVKPSNVMLADGRVHLIDTAFAQMRPSPWRQAVDLGAMMLVLALRTDAETVYARAREHFSDEELGEAIAATHGFAIPSELRRMIAEDGRDLLARFRALAPSHPPIRAHRWGRRRFALLLAVLVAVGAAGYAALVSFQTAGML